MGFGPYSQITKPAEWVDPLNLDLYAKGMMYKQQLAEKNLQDITDTYKSIASLPAYGPDRKKLAEIDQQFREQLSSMDISDLSDMRSTSQIKGLLGQYTTNADVLAIAQRGSTYEKMLKEKEEAEKKNKVYMNRGMNQLSKYFNGEDYIQNIKFGNDGYIAPDTAEIMEQVKKIVTPDEKLVMGSSGEYQIKKYYDPAKLKKAFETVTASNPNWQKYHRDMNEENFDGVNLDDYAKQQYSSLITQNQEVINKANELKKFAKDKKSINYYDLKIKEAQEEIQDINKKLNNPYLGITYKQERYRKSMEDDINNMSEAMQFESEGEIKLKRSSEMKMQFNNDILKEKYKLLLPGAMQYNLTNSELSQIMTTGQVVKNGQPISLTDVSKASIDYEANEAYQKSLKTAQAKAKVKEQLLGKLGNPEIKSTEQITIGGVTQSKALWDTFIKKGNEKNPSWNEGDKSTTAAIIKEFPELFGLTSEQVYSLTGENIKFSNKGGIKIITGFFERNIEAGDFSKLSTAVSKAGTGEAVNQDNPLLKGEVDKNNVLLK